MHDRPHCGLMSIAHEQNVRSELGTSVNSLQKKASSVNGEGYGSTVATSDAPMHSRRAEDDA